MGKIKVARPSPALVVAVLALIAGATGAAVAEPASDSAVTKKKVKKIADKEIQKLAAGLSVANAANAAALEGKPASAFASASSEPYHEVGSPGEPGFQSGWVNTGGGFATAGFYKDSQSVVHLKGTIEGGGNGDVAFTLPEGYRPGAALFLGAAGAGTQAGQLLIAPSGSVAPACDVPPCTVGMDGLGFRVP
jgi:hypothetical protein